MFFFPSLFLMFFFPSDCDIALKYTNLFSLFFSPLLESDCDIALKYTKLFSLFFFPSLFLIISLEFNLSYIKSSKIFNCFSLIFLKLFLYEIPLVLFVNFSFFVTISQISLNISIFETSLHSGIIIGSIIILFLSIILFLIFLYFSVISFVNSFLHLSDIPPFNNFFRYKEPNNCSFVFILFSLFFKEILFFFAIWIN